MKHINIIILSLLILTGCWPCDSVIIDNGKLLEKTLSFVPYKMGQEVQFEHSHGLIISFKAFRETKEERTSCAECCDEIIYEVNSTTLTPEYPIFSFKIDISNIDTMIYGIDAYIGYYHFWIPTTIDYPDYIEKADSVILNDSVYYNVFKLKSDYGSYYEMDSIYADSLYYNYKIGILQIKMSNGENYKIHN